MKVLVETKEGSGPADFNWCGAGELVEFPRHTCDSKTCGCGLSFIGLESRKGTTTAKVVEWSGTLSDLAKVISKSRKASGFDPDLAIAFDAADRIVDFAEQFDIGEIVRIHQEAPE